MNLLAPDLTWVGGQSDIKLRVRGIMSDPQIDGYANVVDGKVRCLTFIEITCPELWRCLSP